MWLLNGNIWAKQLDIEKQTEINGSHICWSANTIKTSQGINFSQDLLRNGLHIQHNLQYLRKNSWKLSLLMHCAVITL